MIQGYVNASYLYTGRGFRKKNGKHVLEDDLSIIPDGAVFFSTKKIKGKNIPDQILWVGDSNAIPSNYKRSKKISLNKKRCITAGWVDCHTHLIFAGDRSNEFAARCAGATYEEIAQKGGGIISTVGPTREASVSALVRLASKRLANMVHYGVRTVEIKSGYGLSLEAEIKSLEAIKVLKEKFPQINIQATFLGAHAFPPDRMREDYFKEILNEMLPLVAKKNLADACDVFIDRGYFQIDEGEAILKKAKKLNLKIKLHADELVNTESAALGVDLAALSVDHLLKISDQGIRKLANSNTVGVLLPATSFYIREPFAPARKLLDAGANIAISTDCNPGSSMCTSLPFVLSLAGLYYKMSQAEILCAVTYNASKALGLEKKQGTLEKGKDAKLTVLPFECFEQAYYQLGWLPVKRYADPF